MVVCELYYRQQNTYKMILLVLFFVMIASSSIAGPAECTGSGATRTFGVNTDSTSRFRIMGYSNLTYFGINSINWVRLLAYSSFNGTFYDASFAPLFVFNVSEGNTCFQTNATIIPTLGASTSVFYVDVTCWNAYLACNIQVSYDGPYCDPQCGTRICGPNVCGTLCGLCDGTCDASGETCTPHTSSTPPTPSDPPTLSYSHSESRTEAIFPPSSSSSLNAMSPAEKAATAVGVIAAVGGIATAGWIYHSRRIGGGQKKDLALF